MKPEWLASREAFGARALLKRVSMKSRDPPGKMDLQLQLDCGNIPMSVLRTSFDKSSSVTRQPIRQFVSPTFAARCLSGQLTLPAA